MNPNEDKKVVMLSLQNKNLQIKKVSMKPFTRYIQTQELGNKKERKREGVKKLSTFQFGKWKCTHLLQKRSNFRQNKRSK